MVPVRGFHGLEWLLGGRHGNQGLRCRAAAPGTPTHLRPTIGHGVPTAHLRRRRPKTILHRGRSCCRGAFCGAARHISCQHAPLYLMRKTVTGKGWAAVGEEWQASEAPDSTVADGPCNRIGRAACSPLAVSFLATENRTNNADRGEDAAHETDSDLPFLVPLNLAWTQQWGLPRHKLPLKMAPAPMLCSPEDSKVRENRGARVTDMSTTLDIPRVSRNQCPLSI